MKKSSFFVHAMTDTIDPVQAIEQMLVQKKYDRALKHCIISSKTCTPAMYGRVLKKFAKAAPPVDLLIAALRETGPYHVAHSNWRGVREKCIDGWVSTRISQIQKAYEGSYWDIVEGIYKIESVFTSPQFNNKDPRYHQSLTSPLYQSVLDGLLASQEWSALNHTLRSKPPQFQVFMAALALFGNPVNVAPVLSAVNPQAIAPPHVNHATWSLWMGEATFKMSAQQKNDLADMLAARQHLLLSIWANDVKEIFKHKVGPDRASDVSKNIETIDALARQWNFDERGKILSWCRYLQLPCPRVQSTDERRMLTKHVDASQVAPAKTHRKM